jgi:hypothetical protein
VVSLSGLSSDPALRGICWCKGDLRQP